MRAVRITILVLAPWLLALTGCSKSRVSGDKPHPVKLVAVASPELAEPLGQVLAHAPHPAEVAAVSSTRLEQRITQGSSKPDLVVACDGPVLSRLQKSGKLVAGSLRPLVEDHLVVIGYPTSPIPLERPEQLARIGARHPPWRGRLLVLDPSTAAGALTRNYLQSLSYEGKSVWDASADRRATAADASAIAKKVETIGRMLAIVPARDAAKMGKKVKIMLALTGKSAPRIRCDVALVQAGHRKQAQQLADFLVAPAQVGVFTKQGWQRAAAAHR